MVAYTYSKLPTANFNTTPPSIARSATGSVYDIGDTGFTTPLNMTMVIGGVVVTTISSDALGFLPDFTLLDRVKCVWKQTGSSFATVLTTSDPIPGPPGPNTVPTQSAIQSEVTTPGTPTAAALTATYEPKGAAAAAAAPKLDSATAATTYAPKATTVPRWVTGTAYTAGQQVISPNGDVVSSIADHTSGASFNPANWNLSANVTAKANASDVIPKWKATTAYAAGDKVVSPTGDIVSANASFTSGASYDATKWTLSPSYVAFGASSGNVVIGSNNFHTPASDTNTGFEVVKSITNPDKTFTGALSGYAVYFGTQQPGTGSIQGGAGESYSLMTGAITQAVLGWEGIGAVAGTGSYQQVIGLASTVLAKDTTTVQQLMGFQARGPVGDAGVTVANAYSIKALEPTTGTNRFTYHGIGTHAFVLGANSASDIVQIQGTAGVRRWGVGGGGVWTGYASDGTSGRMTLDPGDSPTSRISSDIYAGTGQHLTLKSSGSQVLGIEKTGEIRFYDSLKQTTVGAAGAASALPATPTAYFKVKTQAGTTLVIPAYAAT